MSNTNILINKEGALVFTVRNWLPTILSDSPRFAAVPNTWSDMNGPQIGFRRSRTALCAVRTDNCLAVRSNATISEQLYDYLSTNVEWRSENVTLYGKKMLQPRLIYACGNPGLVHKYSGLSLTVDPWSGESPKQWSTIVKDIKDRVEESLKQYDVKFNSCLLNYYRDGKDYIGFHSDKEALGYNNSVVTVSLGGSRDFVFKGKKDKETIKTTLNNGDMTVMLGTTQQLYTHSIPKRANAVGRISLTYRLIH